MPTNNLDTEISSRISSFLSELSQLVKRQALEAVHEALGGAAGPARRGPGRPRKVSMRPGRKPRAMVKRAVKGKRVRRSPEDLQKLQANILAAVKSKQGQRLEEMGRLLRRCSTTSKRKRFRYTSQPGARARARHTVRPSSEELVNLQAIGSPPCVRNETVRSRAPHMRVAATRSARIEASEEGDSVTKTLLFTKDRVFATTIFCAGPPALWRRSRTVPPAFFVARFLTEIPVPLLLFLTMVLHLFVSRNSVPVL